MRDAVTARRRSLWLAATLGTSLALTLSSCTSSSGRSAAGGLESYTDPGDACAQAVSAIGYADDVLRPLGQEPFQEFDDAVRSRLSAVEGTIALEARDWPDAAIRRQADRVAAAAKVAAAHDTPASGRQRALLEYRIEAAQLVLLCRYGPAASR